MTQPYVSDVLGWSDVEDWFDYYPTIHDAEVEPIESNSDRTIIGLCAPHKPDILSRWTVAEAVGVTVLSLDSLMGRGGIIAARDVRVTIEPREA